MIQMLSNYYLSIPEPLLLISGDWMLTETSPLLFAKGFPIVESPLMVDWISTFHEFILPLLQGAKKWNLNLFGIISLFRAGSYSPDCSVYFSAAICIAMSLNHLDICKGRGHAESGDTIIDY